MNPNRPLSPLKSIKGQTLLVLVALISIGVFSAMGVAIYVTRVAGENAEKITGDALQRQTEAHLRQSLVSQANNADQFFNHIAEEVLQASQYLSSVAAHPESFGQMSPDFIQSWLVSGADGQYANPATEPSSVFVPNFQPVDEKIIRDIQFSAPLEFIFSQVQATNPDIEALYFSSPRNMVRYYPNVDLGNVLPPDFKATQRDWYVGSVAEYTSEKPVWWTPPYLDATGLGLVTTAAAPVYGVDGTLLGVIGFDVSLRQLISSMHDLAAVQAGSTFLVDQTGHALALQADTYQLIFGSAQEEQDVYPDISTARTYFRASLSRLQNGANDIDALTVDGAQLYLAYAPLESTGWGLVSLHDTLELQLAIMDMQSEIYSNTQRLVTSGIIPIGIVLTLIVLLAGYVFTDRLVSPLQKLAAEVQKVGSGQWNILIPRTSDNEIGILSRALKTMAEQIHTLVMQLEKRVADRTRDLEKRTLQMRVAAEIARDASSAEDLPELLDRAVNLIRGRFGFYHAGIFLVDDRGEYAVLRAATGEAGRQMLAAGHKLRVGEVGIVGYVTGTGQPRIALDVGEDATHFKNPSLPETRSELAIPLKTSGRIIGALDVQSQHGAAFDENDVTVLQIMADQLAVAIQNARLVENAQESLKELQAIYRTDTHRGWQRQLEASPVYGFEYTVTGVHPVTADNLEQDSEPVTVPLMIRGEHFASLQVWPGDKPFSSSDLSLLEALGERLSLALDSARLYTETQDRAEFERTVHEFTASLQSSLQVDQVLATAAQEIYRQLSISDLSITLEPPESLSYNKNGKHAKSVGIGAEGANS